MLYGLRAAGRIAAGLAGVDELGFLPEKLGPAPAGRRALGAHEALGGGTCPHLILCVWGVKPKVDVLDPRKRSRIGGSVRPLIEKIEQHTNT